MDKYEFNLKIDQMKKLVNEEDYQTALKIADSIEWERVRNTNLLAMAATVYEKNDRLDDARNLLIVALERAPVGKRILFKLAELSVRSGDFEEAEDYYHEYHTIAPDDTGNYLLQYMLLKARHAPYDRQLGPLERYCETDPDEKWLYELATSYEYAGRIEDSVKTCDKIALLYGDSPYSRKALRLKQRYADLTEAQRNILTPRSFTEEQILAAEERGGSYAAPDPYAGRDPVAEYENPLISETQGDDQEDVAETLGRIQVAEEEYETYTAYTADMYRRSDELASDRYEDEDAYFAAYVRAHAIGMPGEEADAEPAPAAVMEAAMEAAPEAMAEPASAAVVEPAAAPVPAVAPAAAPTPVPAAAAAADISEAVPAAEESALQDDEGTQMAFDFAGEEPVVVDEAETTPEEPSAQTIEISAQQVNINVVTPSVTENKEAAAAPAAPAPAAAPIPAPAPVPTPAAPAPVAARPVPPRPVPQARTTFTPAPAPAPAPAPQRAPMPAPAAVPGKKFHMIIEAETPAAGLEIAVDELKAIHEENGIAHASVKTTAEKINLKGLTDGIREKIRGKDFVIENAGDLDKEVVEELYELIRNDSTGTIVVLIDTPEGLDNVEDACPELFDICDYISDIDDEEDEEAAEAARKESGDGRKGGSADRGGYEDSRKAADEEEEDDYDEEDRTPVSVKAAPQKRSNGKVTAERFNNVRTVEPGSGDEQMEIDDFAKYCAQYAASIDCSITGKSMLALYERIELMEEDGIPLTKETAEQLIEEAADRAEKPPLGKRLSGMFKGKYDKNGLLILKEEDFIF